MLTKLLMSRSNKFSSFVGRIYKFRRSYIIYLRMWCTIKLRLILIQFVHVHSCTMVRVYICMWNPETNTDYLCTLFSILCFGVCFHTYQRGWPKRHSNPPHSISLKSEITGVCSCNTFMWLQEVKLTSSCSCLLTGRWAAAEHSHLSALCCIL